jgi:GNAT superfamily N-acetyltransferase
VEQLAGTFDLPLEEKLRDSYTVQVPTLDEPWQIGVIVGPSGSGKTTVAREVFGKYLWTSPEWPPRKAVIDGFGDRPVKEVSQVLSAVGFSSPPSWVKPYAVLSNGEKFRCDLARALLADQPVIAFDEFTSVVDRTVAKIGSAAVAKAIRKGRVERRFVAVTCHYDVVEWLEPDWVLDMASRRLARGRLRRPEIRLSVAPVHRSAWFLFRRHHYLSGNLSNVLKGCFVAFWGDEPVAFSAWINRITKCRRSGDVREHRTVVLPDYQGLGIGNRLSEFCASLFAGLGGRASSTTSHPAMIRYRSASPLWKRTRLGMVNPTGNRGRMIKNAYRSSCCRLTGGFQYVGPAMPRELAEAYLIARPRPLVKRAEVQAIEALVKRYPGATASLLARLSGLSRTAVDHCLAELILWGDVRREGRGGAGEPYSYAEQP